MRRYLVQHGEALTKDIDPERPLSDQGSADITRLAEWLAGRDVTVAQILHSGKTRARQTAELLEPVLESGGLIRPAQDLGPNDPPGVFLNDLKNAKKDILVCGHLPFVARAVSQAVTGSGDQPLVEFRPGSMACLERGESGAWRLVCFVRPGFC